MNSTKIKNYIKKHSSLFWYIREEEKENISKNLLIETILNHGTIEDIKELFKIIDKKEVANIFYKATKDGKRTNYFPEVKNLFTIYFNKYV